jgi:serine/threonine-protein kinase TTK/MPS1
MLDAVNVIHEERIVHSDLKPANFVLIRGMLKLIDFGIAKAIANDTTNIQRDSQVSLGGLNFPLTNVIIDRYSELYESRDDECCPWR